MSRKDFTRGFTLIELLMTVAMVAVLTLVTVPSVMQAVQRHAAADAANALLDTIEFARVQAATTNLAYEIVPTLSSGNTSNGKIEVFQGTSSACMNFKTVSPITGQPAVKIREIDLSQDFPTVRLISTFPEDLPASPLCFKPDGRVFQIQSDVSPMIIPAATGSRYAAGDALIRVQRYDNSGNLEGPVHAVRVPFNGIARKIVE